MERFNRAERRHQLKRIKRNRKHYWGQDLSVRQSGKVANAAQVCSSPYCCGNDRAFYGRTFPEIVQEINEKEGLQELEE